MKIGFLGAGNMGGAILRGYVPKARVKNEELLVFGVNHEKLINTCKETGAEACYTIEELVEKSNIFLIGVKPGKYEEVMPKIADHYTEDKICISMAAGISIGYLESFLGANAKIVRIMPNTPAQVGEAVTSVSFNKNICQEERGRIVEMFEGIGIAREVPEELIHTVIGISGSSPAYTYMYIDGLIKAAVSEGMEYETARKFAAQAVLGAAKMVLETTDSPEQLRINVCSPGGTTIEAVNKLMERDFEAIVGEAFVAATNKSRKMER